MALRGLRPIAEIQYLDYILYAIQILSDDLATTRWRRAAGRSARSSSARAATVSKACGIPARRCRPSSTSCAACAFASPQHDPGRRFLQHDAFRSDDPAIVIEVLNGYRIKEKLPTNIADFTLPLGVPKSCEGGQTSRGQLRAPRCASVMESGGTPRAGRDDAEVDRRADTAAV